MLVYSKLSHKILHSHSTPVYNKTHKFALLIGIKNYRLNVKYSVSNNILLLFIIIFPAITTAQRFGSYLKYGKNELNKENYLEAIKYFNSAVKQRPASYEGYFLRGVAKYSLDDYIGAEKDFTNAIEFDPYNAEIYHYRAIVRSEQYNFGGALEDYGTAIELDPKNPYIYLNRARTNLFLKEYKTAISDCNNAIKHKYKKENVYVIRGMSYSGMELYKEAIEDLNTAIRYDPSNSNTYVQRGSVWMDLHEPDSAIVDFNKAIKIDSVNSYAIFNRALAEMEISDTLGAFSDLNKVIELSPYNSYAYYNRAILKIGQGNEADAIDDLNKVITLNPDNIVVYLYRGQLKKATGDYSGAMEDYSKAIEIYPDFADAWYERSQLKRQLRDFKGAEEDQKMAYRINEFNFSLNDSLKLDEQMYLKRLITFSGEFYDKKTENNKIQDEIVDIELRPVFTTVLYSKDIENIRMFDTYEKPLYHAEVITLTDKECMLDINTANQEIELLDKEIFTKPENPENYFKRAELYSHTHNYNNALFDYNIALMQDPNCIMAYFSRANTRYKLTELLNVEYESQYQLNSDFNPPAGNNLYDTTFLRKSLDEILQDYNKVISLDPDFYFAYFNRGYVKCMNGDYWGAVSDFSKALDIEPNFSEAYFNKGLILIFLNLKTVGCENISHAGELGIQESYSVMKRYCFK